jgi:hypothetical protein
VCPKKDKHVTNDDALPLSGASLWREVRCGRKLASLEHVCVSRLARRKERQKKESPNGRHIRIVLGIFSLCEKGLAKPDNSSSIVTYVSIMEDPILSCHFHLFKHCLLENKMGRPLNKSV